MQYFVLNKDVITGVIHTDIEMHLKSAKYIPTTKESLTTYQKWIRANPNKQPKVANIFTSSTNKASAAAKSITNATTNTNSVSKPLSKDQADKKAMVKQFRHFIINKR